MGTPFGGRPWRRVLGAIIAPQHYRALIGIARTCPDAKEVLSRYLTGGGAYPYRVRLRTPIGPRDAHLFVRDDVLTLNEVFCREDYRTDGSAGTVVDIGSNIGLSALYFLTRGPGVRCHLFEPVPRNVERLRINLAGFEDRYLLQEIAVGAQAGVVEFGVEPTGRYGGIGVRTGNTIRVQCAHINDVLRGVLTTAERIDLLKIDTEGQEARSLAAIEPSLLSRVRQVFLELAPGERIDPPAGFKVTRDGTTWRLVNERGLAPCGP